MSGRLSQEDEIVIAIRRITQAVDTWSRRLWLEYGLTSPQLATLREIIAGKNVTPVALATALHLSQPTVTGILGRLESRGLVRRERSESDRRSILAAATEAGVALAAKAPTLLRDHFCHELAQLPAWRRSEILATFQHVAAMMHAPEVADAPFFFSRNAAANEQAREQTNGDDIRAKVGNAAETQIVGQHRAEV